MKINKYSARSVFIFLGLLQILMLAASAFPPTPRYAAAQSPSISPTTVDWSTEMAQLVAQADLVARAKVVESRSQWNAQHTLIETEHRLAIYYTLLGKQLTTVTIRTDGGFLAKEGLGLYTSHTPRFAPEEEVLLFLAQTETGYRLVGGEKGKYSVIQATAVSAYYHAEQPLEQTITTIVHAATQQGRTATVPAQWRATEADVAARQAKPTITTSLINQPMADPKWPGTNPKVTIYANLNSIHIGAQGGSAEQFLTAIRNAIRTWSVVETATITLVYQGSTTSTSTGFNNKNEIVFMRKGAGTQLGQAQIWFTTAGVIVEADIWINEDYAVDATTNLQGDEVDLESIVLHELGHWLPLNHLNNPAAVMHAVLSAGVRKTVLTNDDIAGVNALYPCPATPCIDAIYVGDSTPTPMPTATATPTTIPTATATPTIVPSTTTGTPTVTPTATPVLTTTPTVTTTPSVVTVRIEGKVLDKETQLGISDVLMTLTGAGQFSVARGVDGGQVYTTMTDLNGVYIFPAVQLDTYTLSGEKAGTNLVTPVPLTVESEAPIQVPPLEVATTPSQLYLPMIMQ
ncbi:MAG: matrixin family metalloprotease [Caldilineaceae bacterium]|nr:matrixin family metalloprotease [Caldilineaceae bacterium]